VKSFRIRLILALIFGITLVSVASTYIEVLEHKHVLRQELMRRTAWQSKSLQSEMEKAMAGGQSAEIAAAVARLCAQDEALGLGVYDLQGGLETEAGPAGVFGALPPDHLNKAIQQGADSSVFGHQNDQQWLEEAMPLYVNGRMAGALVVLEDARSIRAEGVRIWRQSFWQIAALVLLIVGVTLLMVRWFLMRPMVKVAARLRGLRLGTTADLEDESFADLSLFYSAGPRSGDDGREPDRSPRRGCNRSPAAQRRRAPVDRRAAGRSYSRALWLQPHLRIVEPRAVHACAPRAGDGVHRSSQRSGDGPRAGTAGV